MGIISILYWQRHCRRWICFENSLRHGMHIEESACGVGWVVRDGFLDPALKYESDVPTAHIVSDLYRTIQKLSDIPLKHLHPTHRKFSHIGLI